MTRTNTSDRRTQVTLNNLPAAMDAEYARLLISEPTLTVNERIAKAITRTTQNAGVYIAPYKESEVEMLINTVATNRGGTVDSTTMTTLKTNFNISVQDVTAPPI